jgi:hypothetical protein
LLGAIPQLAADALKWGVLLIAGFLLMGMVAFLLRRKLLSPSAPDVSPTWSLQHLRDLRDKGQITLKEYDTLREKLLAMHGAGRAAKNRDAGNDAQE